MPIILGYQLEDAGWAEVTIGNGLQQATVEVSYLHDSLGNLANAALELISNAGKAQTVVFMGEPGEYQLRLNLVDTTLLKAELRGYDDWASWGMHPDTDYELVFEAQSTPVDFGVVVQRNLERIWLENGRQGYRNKWIEHEFPYQEYLALTRNLCGLNKKSPH